MRRLFEEWLYGGKKEEVAGLQAAELKTDGKLTLQG